MGCLVRQSFKATEHVVAHVCKDEALGANERQVFDQSAEIQVKFDLLVEEVCLGDKDICVCSGRYQLIRPFGVAGVRNRSAFCLQPVREEWATGVAMVHLKWLDNDPCNFLRLGRMKLDERKGKLWLCERRPRESCFKHSLVPTPQARRADDCQRLGPPKASPLPMNVRFMCKTL